MNAAFLFKIFFLICLFSFFGYLKILLHCFLTLHFFQQKAFFRFSLLSVFVGILIMMGFVVFCMCLLLGTCVTCLQVYSFHHIWKISSHHFFRYCFCPSLSPSSLSATPVALTLVCFQVCSSQFLLFFKFSSSLLFYSVSSPLNLSSVFFISDIIFFTFRSSLYIFKKYLPCLPLLS